VKIKDKKIIFKENFLVDSKSNNLSDEDQFKLNKDIQYQQFKVNENKFFFVFFRELPLLFIINFWGIAPY
jgi:hypothetical protein